MTLYSPLSLPLSLTRKERIHDFLLTGFLRSTRAKYLVAQIRKREDIPREVWGPNPNRYILACEIAVIIREEIGWPNANFIPEDPMRLVLYKLDTEGLFWDNLELETIFMRTEDIVGRSLAEENYEQIYQGTFGEAVDLLLHMKLGIAPKQDL